MKTRIEGLIFSAMLGALPVVACSKSNERTASEPNVAENDNQTAGSRQTLSATTAIAQSRCNREQRCDNVGADKKYSSMTDCEARIRNDWRDDLNARECPHGVNETQLDECLTRIKNEDCGNPFDSLARVAACTKGQICQE